jgi:hypothetical protein
LLAALSCRQPINQLSGQAHPHSILAILYAILNLSPALRMSTCTVQVASLLNDHDAKEVGMDEVINGLETSIGAQLAAFEKLSKPVQVRNREGTGVETRQMSIHGVLYAADFPAAASMLAAKGSTSAHRYDRKSTIDQRSERYGEPFSLLDPKPASAVDDEDPAFRRLTHDEFREVLEKAARLRTAKQREVFLTDHGLNAESFIFDGRGNYKLHFALAKIRGLDWLNGNSTDYMHTSLQGTVPLESGLQQYMNIRVHKYYTRPELNTARRKIIPSAFMVPEFGKYIEEGATGNVPSPTGRVKFTASQSRHWLEYGTAVMESIFAEKALHPFSNAAARYTSSSLRGPLRGTPAEHASHLALVCPAFHATLLATRARTGGHVASRLRMSAHCT